MTHINIVITYLHIYIIIIHLHNYYILKLQIYLLLNKCTMVTSIQVNTAISMYFENRNCQLIIFIHNCEYTFH